MSRSTGMPDRLPTFGLAVGATRCYWSRTSMDSGGDGRCRHGRARARSEVEDGHIPVHRPDRSRRGGSLWSSRSVTRTETFMESTLGLPAAPTGGSTRKDKAMAKAIDPALVEKLRRESEQTKDDPYPEGAKGTRPNRARSKVYSVRLSAEEEAEVQRVAEARHLPPSTLVRSWILERLDRERSA